MKIEKEKSSFDFEEFKNQAIADMKAGKSLVGKDGVFTPLMKEFLEAALEGEMNSHRDLRKRQVRKGFQDFRRALGG